MGRALQVEKKCAKDRAKIAPFGIFFVAWKAISFPSARNGLLQLKPWAA
jgi:hypothetical protein